MLGTVTQQLLAPVAKGYGVNSRAAISEQQFRAAIMPEQVRSLRIMQAYLTVGLLVFAAAIVYIATRRPEIPVPTASGTQWVLRASLVHGAVFVLAWLFSDVATRTALRRAYQGSMQPVSTARGGNGVTTGSAEAAMEAIRSAVVLRLALREAPALFGLGICYIAVGNGVLDAHPAVALNAGSAAAAIAFFITTLPTPERLVAVFRKHWQSAAA